MERARESEARRLLDRASAADGEEGSEALGKLARLILRHAEGEERLFRRLKGKLDGESMRRLGGSMLALFDAMVEGSPSAG